MSKIFSNKNLQVTFLLIFIIIISIVSILLVFGPSTVNSLRLATTTSTDNSGLLDYLHKEASKSINSKIDVIAVGTGAALEYARSGLVDVVIVHARSLEDQFIEEGYGFHRVDLMFNDFVIVGPSSDPANIRGLNNSSEVFERIDNAKNDLKFVSRGDNSGTHIKELELWSLAGYIINSDVRNWINKNQWYLETGSGMGSTLTIASQLQAYTLTDRGTWLFMKERLSLELLTEGPELWHNQYGAILVNPENFETKINFELAKKYVQWLINPIGQGMINDYKINGDQAFFANFLDRIDDLSSEEKQFWGIQNPFIKGNFKLIPNNQIKKLISLPFGVPQHDK